jgi:hypothetical protein
MARNEMGTAKEIFAEVKAEKVGRKKTSVYIDPVVWEEFKIAVKAEGLFLSDVLEKVLVKFVKGT